MKNFIKIIFVLMIMFSVSSCKVKKSVADVVINDKTTSNNPNGNKTNTSNGNDPKEAVSKNDTVIQTTVTGQTSFELKSEYNVAIILPLFNDSINSNYSNSIKSNLSDFVIPDIALKSITFIEGMLLALEKNKGSKLNIQIFDNQASQFQTNNILNKLSFENIDFIVGPMQNKNIKLVSAFAKKNDIVMISPFSHSTLAGNKYAKYIMPTPSLDIHLKAISTYIKDSIDNSNIKILYPNTVKSEQFAFRLQNILNHLNESIKELDKKLNYALIEVEANTNSRKNFKMEDYLDAGKKNVVIVLPSKTGFVHNMLTMLNQQLKEYEITVFGMPNWKDSKTLRLDYFNNLNVHFSDVKWIDKNNLETSNFILNYKNNYSGEPTDQAFLAYDVFNFLAISLEKYGLDFPQNISNESFNGIYGNYSFKPSKSTSLLDILDPKTVRIENNALHIISYKNFQLILEQ